jgi:hypothetical protein
MGKINSSAGDSIKQTGTPLVQQKLMDLEDFARRAPKSELMTSIGKKYFAFFRRRIRMASYDTPQARRYDPKLTLANHGVSRLGIGG